MRVPSQQTFQINLSSEHIATILDGLSELPFKRSNVIIKYIQQQMQSQLIQAQQVNAANEEAAKQALTEAVEKEAEAALAKASED